MKNPFRRRSRPTWPPEQERRKPENAELRGTVDAWHKAQVRDQAERAKTETATTTRELDVLEAQVRLLRLKAGDL